MKERKKERKKSHADCSGNAAGLLWLEAGDQQSEQWHGLEEKFSTIDQCVVVTLPAVEENDDDFCDIHVPLMICQMTYQKHNLMFIKDKEISFLYSIFLQPTIDRIWML